MAGKTDAFEARLLDHLFRGGATPALISLTAVYVALGTDANTDTQRDAGTFTEVVGGSYARVSVAASTFARSGTAPTQVANNATVTFATATANWGTITVFFIADAPTGGNLLYWGSIGSVVVNTSDTPQFASGQLVVSED